MVVHSTFKTQHPKQSIKPQQFTKIGSAHALRCSGKSTTR